MDGHAGEHRVRYAASLMRVTNGARHKVSGKGAWNRARVY